MVKCSQLNALYVGNTYREIAANNLKRKHHDTIRTSTLHRRLPISKRLDGSREKEKQFNMLSPCFTLHDTISPNRSNLASVYLNSLTALDTGQNKVRRMVVQNNGQFPNRTNPQNTPLGTLRCRPSIPLYLDLVGCFVCVERQC